MTTLLFVDAMYCVCVCKTLLDYRNVEDRCQSEVNVMSVSGRTERRLPYCPGGHMCECG